MFLLSVAVRCARIFIPLLLLSVVGVYSYSITKVVVPLDSGIYLLKHSDLKNSVNTTSGVDLSDSSIYIPKRLLLSTDQNTGEHSYLNIPLHNTILVRRIESLDSFPVLSLDYGSRFVGISLHHMGSSKVLGNLINTGDVPQLCDRIYSLLKENVITITRFLILVGLPLSRGKPTDAHHLFQNLFNLDFATRLSRYITQRHIESYGNWESLISSGKLLHTFNTKCFMCSNGLRPCLYNNNCEESFEIQPSDYGSANVIGVSEHSSTYQTELFNGTSSRRDALASIIIYRNLVDSLRSPHTDNLPFLVLPSNNNIFRNHTKGDCLMLYKHLWSKLSKSKNGSY